MSRKKMTINPDAEEATMTTPITDAEHTQNMLESSLGTAEMTDAEAIETLVRTDEERLSEEPVQVTPESDAVSRSKQKATYEGEKFHMLSQIDDGVFVAWDRCRKCNKAVSECKDKGGPTEAPYVTAWRQEWIDKRDKETKKVIDTPKKEARQTVGLEPLTATVSDGIDTAMEAVRAAATEEVSND